MKIKLRRRQRDNERNIFFSQWVLPTGIFMHEAIALTSAAIQIKFYKSYFSSVCILQTKYFTGLLQKFYVTWYLYFTQRRYSIFRKQEIKI